LITTFDEDNLAEHGATCAEIKEVFESDLSFTVDLEPSKRGYDRMMVIGWTYKGRILEVGVELIEVGDREHIFHAMDAGKQYRREFERRLGHGDQVKQDEQ